jgi:DNA-binding helix-hairpin-helix protein with protein kinase domain
VTRVSGTAFVRPPPIRPKSGELEGPVATLLDACLAEDADARPEARTLADALGEYALRLTKAAPRATA